MQRVFIIGSSLFTESLVQILTSEGGVMVIGTAPTPEEAFPAFETKIPDAVIVAGPTEIAQFFLGLLLTTFPNLPVIYANPNAEHMEVITSQQVGANPSDLVDILIKLANHV